MGITNQQIQEQWAQSNELQRAMMEAFSQAMKEQNAIFTSTTKIIMENASETSQAFQKTVNDLMDRDERNHETFRNAMQKMATSQVLMSERVEGHSRNWDKFWKYGLGVIFSALAGGGLVAAAVQLLR